MKYNWKDVRREGKILNRSDIEDEGGVYSEFWVEHEGKYFYCSMLNGDVVVFVEMDYPWSIK